VIEFRTSTTTIDLWYTAVSLFIYKSKYVSRSPDLKCQGFYIVVYIPLVSQSSGTTWTR